MVQFAFYNPVRILFGAKTVDDIGGETRRYGKRVLLVTYRDLSAIREVVKRVEDSLGRNGCQIEPFPEVVPNPRVSEVRRGIALCRDRRIEVLVAVGGGSVIDTAKLIALAYRYQGDVWDLFGLYKEARTLPQEALPVLTVTTLPGTSSEMNSGAVVTNDELKEKSFLYSEQIFPKVSILDPELTCSLPANLTACGAADALSHILEPYLSSVDDRSPVQERLQEALAAAIMEQTLRVRDDLRNVEKRGSLQWAITLAHNGWVKTGVKYAAPMHLIGHVLSARYDIAHGMAMSVIMPAWMKTVCDRRVGKLNQFGARVFNLPADSSADTRQAAEGIAHFEAYLRNSGVPVRLSELPGLRWGEQELVEIRDDVIRVSFDDGGFLPGNPKLNANEVLQLLQTAR